MPGLLGIGGLASVIKGNAAKQFYKVAGLAVIIFALFNISNGFGLVGFTFPVIGTKSAYLSNDPNVKIENGVQVVRMKELGNGYSPNQFTIKKGIPVKWVIDAQAPYSCAASIVMPKYNIQRNLQAGENIIEFTPNEIGVIRFSCSMGMYTGSFNVVDENSAINSNSLTSASNLTSNNVQPSGSCGGGGGGCGCGGGSAKNFPATQGATAGGANNANTSQKQIINSVYTLSNDIQPNIFRVKAGIPVKYTIDVRESGIGCMAAIMIQDLYTTPIQLVAGNKIVMEFTPSVLGEYKITCAMAVPRGTIIVE
jgi:plastocyanin domain-containing protein